MSCFEFIHTEDLFKLIGVTKNKCAIFQQFIFTNIDHAKCVFRQIVHDILLNQKKVNILYLNNAINFLAIEFEGVTSMIDILCEVLSQLSLQVHNFLQEKIDEGKIDLKHIVESRNLFVDNVEILFRGMFYLEKFIMLRIKINVFAIIRDRIFFLNVINSNYNYKNTSKKIHQIIHDNESIDNESIDNESIDNIINSFYRMNCRSTIDIRFNQSGQLKYMSSDLSILNNYSLLDFTETENIVDLIDQMIEEYIFKNNEVLVEKILNLIKVCLFYSDATFFCLIYSDRLEKRLLKAEPNLFLEEKLLENLNYVEIYDVYFKMKNMINDIKNSILISSSYGSMCSTQNLMYYRRAALFKILGKKNWSLFGPCNKSCLERFITRSPISKALELFDNHYKEKNANFKKLAFDYVNSIVSLSISFKTQRIEITMNLLQACIIYLLNDKEEVTTSEIAENFDINADILNFALNSFHILGIIVLDTQTKLLSLNQNVTLQQLEKYIKHVVKIGDIAAVSIIEFNNEVSGRLVKAVASDKIIDNYLQERKIKSDIIKILSIDKRNVDSIYEEFTIHSKNDINKNILELVNMGILDAKFVKNEIRYEVKI